MTEGLTQTTAPETRSRLRRWLASLDAWVAPLVAPERRTDLVGAFTLVVLLLTSEDTWIMQVGVTALAAAAVVDRRLLRYAGFWFAVLAVYIAGVASVIIRIDNHEWLLGYWLLALALSRLQTDPDAGLATSARLLIGLAFAFATIWKLATPEYVDGNAFHTFILFDNRFAGVASLVSPVTLAESFGNYTLYEVLRAIGDGGVTTAVADGPGVRLAAIGMTWWTVLIEGLVAVCFLAPPTTALGRARHIVLLVFLWTTYILAPVKGFGWLLIAMGVAQAPLDRHRLYLPAFAVAFVLVLVRSTAPFARIFEVFFPNLF